jgi:ParB-like chromosome segregation protein Spo0J
MQIEFVKIEQLIPYARNSRTHSDEQVAQIAGSIKEFGFTNPVLVGVDNDIIAGHGRVLAARKLSLKEVPCIRLGHLTKTQKQAYIIADNKIALNAGWDEELLKIEFIELEDEGFDLGLSGFDAGELQCFIKEPIASGSLVTAQQTASDAEQSKEHVEDEATGSEGARELDESSFSNFDHQCPRCNFEFND